MRKIKTLREYDTPLHMPFTVGSWRGSDRPRLETQQNTISLNKSQDDSSSSSPVHLPACSISNQKEAPRKRSDNARRKFCTASWAFDCLWPQQTAQNNAQAMPGTSTSSKDSEQNHLCKVEIADMTLRKKSHRHFP